MRAIGAIKVGASSLAMVAMVTSPPIKILYFRNKNFTKNT